MAVAEKLKHYIDDKGLVTRRLAERIGVNEPSLYAMLSGRQRMDVETFSKLVKEMNVKSDQFM